MTWTTKVFGIIKNDGFNSEKLYDFSVDGVNQSYFDILLTPRHQ